MGKYLPRNRPSDPLDKAVHPVLTKYSTIEKVGLKRMKSLLGGVSQTIIIRQAVRFILGMESMFKGPMPPYEELAKQLEEADPNMD